MRAGARTHLRWVAGFASVLVGAFAIAGCTTTAARGNGSTVKVTGHQLTIYLSVPPGAAADPAVQDLIDAEQLACQRDSGEVTAFTVRCRRAAANELSANARRAIQDSSSIAYIGEAAPGTSQDTVGITNALDLLEVSPTDGALELTRSTPAVPDAPSHYYESWSTYGRTYAHVVPSTGQEASALVAAMRRDGVGSVYVAHDNSDYGAAIARAVLGDAGSSPTIASSESGADAIFYASESPAAGAQFLDHAAQVDPSARLFGPAAFDAPVFVHSLSPAAARAVRITTPGFTQPPAGARASFTLPFVRAYGHQPAPEAIYGYAAVEALFGVLRQAGSAANNRATIVRDYLKLKDPSSVLGDLSIMPDGDTTPASFVINRVKGGRLVGVGSSP
jgi:branched-chain amino acid transport system substrate-binding protein